MDASVMDYPTAEASALRLFQSGIDAVLIDGPPGTGKTAMRNAIAKGLGMAGVFMIKLSHHDVPDVAGVPVPREDTKRTHFYASADMLPPEDGKARLVVIDEVGDCNVAQQNLACQMVFELAIHNYKFAPGTKFLLTSNRVQDRSGANRIVTKLGNRCAIITLAPTPDNLFDYGARNGWNPTVLAFLKMHGSEAINPNDTRAARPTYFNSFDPTDPAQMVKPQFASSRSYEFVSNYFNAMDAGTITADFGLMTGDVAAILGTPVASRLVAFRKIAAEMPDPDGILAGKNVVYPKKQEVLWSLTLTLTSKVAKQNVGHLHAFLDKGPDEFLALAARILFDTKSGELASKDFTKLIMSPKLADMFSAN